MTYSLINVSQDHGDTVDGNWIQDSIGDLDKAKRVAQATREVNGNKINVVVTEAVVGSNPILRHHYNLKVVARGGVV